MGTASEWMSAVIWGVFFWGGPMLIWEAYSRTERNINPALSAMDVLSLALLGLSVGIGETFHWRALHWPIISVTLISTAGGVVSARMAKRKFRQEE